MAVREVSAHDAFRLLKSNLPKFLDQVQEASKSSEKPSVWVPESVAVGPEAPFSWTFSSAATCSVYPDHLQSISDLSAAGMVGRQFDNTAVQGWLKEKHGKEVNVRGITGVPTHFVVVQDGAKPDAGTEVNTLRVRSVRDGEEVRFGNITATVHLGCETATDMVSTLKCNLQAAIVMFCRALHVTELECGVSTGSVYILSDIVLQLDETASYLCDKIWGSCRFPVGFGRPEMPEEVKIHELDARTGASLKFTVLNRDARIWTLIAGGGASVVYTDTICEYGFAKELANYGEYSGDPPEDLVYEYTKTIFGVMTSAKGTGKILLIGGGVANFTDVASTFKGIIRALKEFEKPLQACGTRVWVRRGGPNSVEGLAMLKRACEDIGIPAKIYGPEAHLTAIVRDALISADGSKALPEMPPPVVKIPTVWNNGHSNQGIMNFTADTQAFVYGMQTKAVQRMLDFDTLCGRKTPSVAALINPTGQPTFEKFMFGSADCLVPVYTSLKDAVERHGQAEKMLVNFASFRSVYDSTMEALQFTEVIKTHAIIAEGVPEALTRRLHHEAAKKNVAIIGPATVGGMMPGRFRIGNAGGAVENLLLAKLFRPGSVGYTTKSGGMSNELNNIVSLNTDGVYEGIAIGGDRWPGVRFLDVIERFEANPNIKMMVLLGEVGGREEYSVAEAIQSGRITKPVVAWCCGTAAEAFDYDVQFGHAGARARSDEEKAGAKNLALAKAGAHVPRSFDEYGDLIAKVYKALVDGGAIKPAAEVPEPKLPQDYDALKKKGLVRKPANFVCSISDDRGPEPTYAGVPISEIASDDALGIGGAVSLLWFRRRLPAYASKFIELCLVVTADHGPCVSGAHNTIVAARAGKDLVSSLIAGLATIGPRFGGALDDAARMFTGALDVGLTPAQFIDKCKKDQTVIMGIGHKIKSLDNPDARVVLIKGYAKKHFASTPLLDFALAVEQLTTKKKSSLILNVDGCIAVCWVDLLRTCGCFSKAEADELVESGVLNGLFVSSRTLGLVGHFLDQKRLKQPLYRHPADDITYL